MREFLHGEGTRLWCWLYEPTLEMHAIDLSINTLKYECMQKLVKSVLYLIVLCQSTPSIIHSSCLISHHWGKLNLGIHELCTIFATDDSIIILKWKLFQILKLNGHINNRQITEEKKKELLIWKADLRKSPKAHQLRKIKRWKVQKHWDMEDKEVFHISLRRIADRKDRENVGKKLSE